MLSQEEYDRVCAHDPVSDAFEGMLVDCGLRPSLSALSETAAGSVVVALAKRFAGDFEALLSVKQV